MAANIPKDNHPFSLSGGSGLAQGTPFIASHGSVYGVDQDDMDARMEAAIKQSFQANAAQNIPAGTSSLIDPKMQQKIVDICKEVAQDFKRLDGDEKVEYDARRIQTVRGICISRLKEAKITAYFSGREGQQALDKFVDETLKSIYKV